MLGDIWVPRLGPGRPSTTPDAVLGDKAYSSRGNREMLRRRGIQVVIPEPSDQQANRKRHSSAGSVTDDSLLGNELATSLLSGVVNDRAELTAFAKRRALRGHALTGKHDTHRNPELDALPLNEPRRSLTPTTSSTTTKGRPERDALTGPSQLGQSPRAVRPRYPRRTTPSAKPPTIKAGSPP
ncbi:hypothetical protein NKG05_25620 [Oerskovia sp. M15]